MCVLCLLRVRPRDCCRVYVCSVRVTPSVSKNVWLVVGPPPHRAVCVVWMSARRLMETVRRLLFRGPEFRTGALGSVGAWRRCDLPLTTLLPCPPPIFFVLLPYAVGGGR